MSEIRYNIGDSVWFPFDNGTKEQKGEIKWFSNVNEYAILGNVDKKIHFVKENEISIIAPHKRYLEIKDNKKRCSNCRWHDKCIDEHPCSNCNGFIHSNWEPKVEKVDYRSFYPVTTGLSSPIYDDLKRHIDTQLASEQMWGIAASTKLFGIIPDNTSVITVKNGTSITCDGFKGGKKFMEENKKMVIRTVTYKREIKDIIFSGPATVIKFNNQFDKEEKTVVKCQNGDEFDKTKGFLLALVKEFVDKKSWNNILRIIDTFEEEKDEKDKNIAEIFDSLPEKVKNDIYVEIERASRPTRKFSGQDIVKLSKSNTGYIIERCRWNEDKKCWEYFCNNGNGYCRWYEEDRLVFA